ncbi:4'-phosphopantetheinyl transferase family protein [Peribacillus simplex]|uniref:4'-phosphopantetheinyl transferase family protein n=1 Tax=Peribacillus simplex TaxID=1478 RepID=UPI003D290BBD
MTTTKLHLTRITKTYEGSMTLLTGNDCVEAKRILAPNEYKCYVEFKSEKRKSEYLYGRYAAKISAMELLGESDPKKVEIISGVFSQPILRCNNNIDNISVSISHTSNMVGALAFPETHPMAIDVEEIDRMNLDLIVQHLLPDEQDMVVKAKTFETSMATLLWSVKESLSKVLKTGLTISIPLLKISKKVKNDDHYVFEFEHFTQYKVQGWMIENYVLTICLPKNTTLKMDLIPMNFDKI